MTPYQEQAKEEFEEACRNMQTAGFNVVACVQTYSETDSKKEVFVALIPQPEFGVTEDHIIMDALHEITTEWFMRNHGDQGA